MRQFANVADDTLASGISAGAMSSTLNDASEFPATGDFTIRFESASNPNTYELVTATARSGNVLTHGATANAWSAGDKVYQVVAKADLDLFIQSGSPAGGVLAGAYPDPSFASDMATQAELNTHEADTTSVHGITDTANILLKTLADAKGDLLAATAADTIARLAIGAEGTVPVSRAAAATGIAWEAPSGGGGATVVRKTADESVTTSTTYQNDNHLTFPIGSSEVIVAEWYLIVGTGTVGDFKVQFSVPAGAAYRLSLHPAWGDTDAFIASASMPSQITGIGTSGTNRGVLIKTIFVNGSTAGNVTLQWAQDTSSGTATTVFTNSYVAYQVGT